MPAYRQSRIVRSPETKPSATAALTFIISVAKASAVPFLFWVEFSQSQTVRFLAIWPWAEGVGSTSSTGLLVAAVFVEASIQLIAPLGSLIVRCMEASQ